MNLCIPEIAESISRIVNRSNNREFQIGSLEALKIDSLGTIKSRLESLMREVVQNDANCSKKSDSKKRKDRENLLLPFV